MRKSQFSSEQTAYCLTQAEAGVPIGELCCKYGIGASSVYRWKSKFGAMSPTEVRRLKDLEEENVGSSGWSLTSAWTSRSSRTRSEKKSERCGQATTGKRSDGELRRQRASRLQCAVRFAQEQTLREPSTGRSALKQRLSELALARPRYGYVRLHVLLRREGWLVNKRKAYRLHHELGLMVRTKRRRKHASHLRVTPSPTQHRNERWAMDFVSDSTADGRAFRSLTIVDDVSKICPGLEVDTSLSGLRVVRARNERSRSTANPSDS